MGTISNGTGGGDNIGVIGQATNGSGTNIGVKGSASGASTNWAGYFADGNVKIENDLKIMGNILIAGGSPASGAVLTSNGIGEATWQTPATASSPWDSFLSLIHI